MTDLVVDTDVVSFGFRQDARFIEHYGPAIQGHRAIVSFMTVAELKFGAYHRQWSDRRIGELQTYVDRFFVRYGVSESICEVWAKLIVDAKANGRILSGSDAWIAATSVVLDVPLVSHNAKDFRHLSGVNLITFPDN